MQVKDVFTTGEVAKLCNVAARTVTKWFDNGLLKGYRIPGSRDRRIPREQLTRFMRAHGIASDGLDVGVIRVLICDGNYTLADMLRTALERNLGYSVQVATSGFQAGVIARSFRPHVILLDLDTDGIDGKDVWRALRSDPDLSATRVIAIGKNISEERREDLLREGFDSVASKPLDLRSVAQRIADATNIIA